MLHPMTWSSDVKHDQTYEAMRELRNRADRKFENNQTMQLCGLAMAAAFATGIETYGAWCGVMYLACMAAWCFLCFKGTNVALDESSRRIALCAIASEFPEGDERKHNLMNRIAASRITAREVLDEMGHQVWLDTEGVAVRSGALTAVGVIVEESKQDARGQLT
jgi:hypothetical protein